MRDDDAYLLRDLHPEIPWIEIVGMRNRLVHAYFEVDVELLWETVQRDIPKLISLIEPLCRRKNRRVERSRRGQHRSVLQGVPDRGPGLRPPLRRRAVRRGQRLQQTARHRGVARGPRDLPSGPRSGHYPFTLLAFTP